MWRHFWFLVEFRRVGGFFVFFLILILVEPLQVVCVEKDDGDLSCSIRFQVKSPHMLCILEMWKWKEKNGLLLGQKKEKKDES